MNTGRGIVRAYDVATGRATVEVIGGHSGWVDMPVATNLSAANLTVGRRCLVWFFDVLNPLDGLVVATYDTVADLLANHDHTGNYAGDGGKITPVSINSGAAPDYSALIADGAGGCAFETNVPAHDHSGDAGDGGVLAVYPKRGTMWHHEALVTAGNALASSFYATQMFGFAMYQNTAANADTFTHGCYLAAGTYSFSVLGVTSSNRGKIDWTLDGSSIVAGEDWYSASLVNSVIKVTASVSVATSGWHTLQGRINGKNGSSGGYLMTLTKYWFTPAAD